MDKYRRIKVVGKGSFGHAILVQLVSDPAKLYIMKIIDVSKLERKQKEEALNEVHVLKAMRHPYIVTYRESFIEKRCLCIVMDYCDGGDLYTKINQKKQANDLFTEDQILDWFVQLALAIKHVHDRKILHRDIKTQNIFLTSKGDVKLGDFGIARILHSSDDCARTAIGTPYYLSPEICQEKPYNQKSDVWSLGCILYEMSTLNHAFDADSMKGLVQKILHGSYAPIAPQFSDDLRSLIDELLTKDPIKRPTIKQVLQKPFLALRISEMLKKNLSRGPLDIRQFQSVPSVISKTSEDERMSPPNTKKTSLYLEDRKDANSDQKKKPGIFSYNTEDDRTPKIPSFSEQQKMSNQKAKERLSNNEYDMKPNADSSPVKFYTEPDSRYSPIKNVNNVIRENLSLISHIRVSKDNPHKSFEGLRNQFKIIQNNLESNDVFNKTPEDVLVNISNFSPLQKEKNISKLKGSRSVMNLHDNKMEAKYVLEDTVVAEEEPESINYDSEILKIEKAKSELEKKIGKDIFNKAFTFARVNEKKFVDLQKNYRSNTYEQKLIQILGEKNKGHIPRIIELAKKEEELDN